mgnify:CR=1 FL=1
MSEQTGNQQLVKQINKSIVLNTIKNNAPISRADIAQKTGLNKGTVSSLVNELIEEHLIYESGLGESSGGRRPIILLFNHQAGFAIGIDLEVNYILGILTDLFGNIVMEIHEKLTMCEYDQVLKVLKSIIQKLIHATPDSPYEIIGMGIGVPGLVNNDGVILTAPNLGWKNIRLKDEIEKTFRIPVYIENEANAGAYGEKNFGSKKDYHNILYISAGIGIGVGIVLNGKLFTGSNGFSGEMGHSIIVADGKECPCGSQGCWELYASEHALLKKAKNANISGITDENVSIEMLMNLAENGDETVIQIFKEIAKYLGIGINNIVNIFNPDQIIIGNRLAKAKKWLEQPIKDFVKKHSMVYHQRNLSINFSQLEIHSTALGMSALTIESFLNKYVSN